MCHQSTLGEYRQLCLLRALWHQSNKRHPMGAEEGMESIMLVAKKIDSRDPSWERYGHDHGEVFKEVAKSHRPMTATGD